MSSRRAARSSAAATWGGGPTSGLPRPRSTSGSPSRAADAATRASSDMKYCSGSRSSRFGGARRSLRGRPLGAPELDGKLEHDVFVRRAMLHDVGDTAIAEPVAHVGDEPLRSRRAGGEADDRCAFEPRRTDLARVVDEVRLDAGRARDLDEAERVRRVAGADDEEQVDLVEELLHRPLPVGGCVADVFARGSLELGEPAAQHVDDLAGLVDGEGRL